MRSHASPKTRQCPVGAVARFSVVLGEAFVLEDFGKQPLGKKEL